jgi:hypothetical protein
MKSEENVNTGTEQRHFGKIPFDNRQNMESQIVACDSRTQKTGSTCLGYKISKKAEPFLTPPFMFDTES